MTTDECCICLETTDAPLQTPCKHNYCNPCLTGWLLKKNSCPMCRYAIGETSESEKEEELNIRVILNFSGDPHILRSGNQSSVVILQNYHYDLIDELILSQVNENNNHTWQTFNIPDYFEYKLKKKKISYYMSCHVYDKTHMFITIGIERIQPKYTRTSNKSWVFKSKRKQCKRVRAGNF